MVDVRHVSGGTIQWAFPDYQILLGRRNLQKATANTSPRIVFIPTDGRGWGFEPYGGAGPDITPAQVPNVRGSVQQQSMTLQPQLATQFTTFEVYVTGSAPNYGADAPDPDYGDFDATQAIVYVLYSVLFDGVGGLPRARVLREMWPSQRVDAGSQLQRGQQWMGVIEFQQPVTKVPLTFVPIGTSIEMSVAPLNAGSTDAEVIVIEPV